MDSIFYAYYDSRNFSFDAIGTDKRSAIQTLLDGLNKHGEQYNLESDWFYKEDIQVREMKFDQCYRDRDTL